MGLLKEISAELFVMAGIGLVLGLLGPFGTFALPAGIRLPAWIALSLGGYACFRPVLAAGHAMHARTGMPLLAAQAIACIIAAVPTTIVVALVFAWLRIAPASIDAMALGYPQVLLVGTIATAIQIALFRGERATPPAEMPSPAAAAQPVAPLPSMPPAVAPPAFLDRLPPSQRQELLCLEMEDHYVRAHGPAGSTLVLIRMRDAVAELAGVDGMRVHRSWWVARAAVAEVVRRDRAVLLRLVNGLEVPVARNEVPALRAAGWL